MHPEPPLTTLFSWDGGLTLLPPLVAIALALLTRRVVPSLLAAVLVAAVVVTKGDLLAAPATLVERVVAVVTSRDNLLISGFSVLVAATVGVMGASGGTYALVERIERLARGRRGTMAATAAAGGVVFFDDYANCLVVGSAMGPLCDRNRVSRAKLAYIVDSTAAPLASLALVSTWIGFEVGQFAETLSALPEVDIAAFPLFLSAIPYRFYCILTLVFVAAIAWTGRDFGPMRAAEADPRPPLSAEREAEVRGDGGPWHAAVPVSALVLVTFGALWWDGSSALGPAAAEARLFEILGEADPFQSMLYGGLAGFGLAAALALATSALPVARLPSATWAGVRPVAAALVVLYLAWTLGGLIQATPADDFLASLLADRMPAWALPAGVFVVAAATSFSTGSSFFTMLTLIPLALPLAVSLGGPDAGPVLLATAAAVLDGSVLGDHASPISDTTVLSSMGAGTDVITHVRTQLPYALTVGVVAVVLGAVPAGLGVSPVLSLLMGAAACVGVVRIVGRPVTAPGPLPDLG